MIYSHKMTENLKCIFLFSSGKKTSNNMDGFSRAQKLGKLSKPAEIE